MENNTSPEPMLRKPAWLKAPLGGGSEYHKLAKSIQEKNLHTVCAEAHCPNKGECWSRGVATLMILGDTCTRACAFCNVKTGRPASTDVQEPIRVAEAVRDMNLRYLTLTSVDRDDMEDFGAEIWSETIRRIKHDQPSIKIEALVPDFQGRTELLDVVLHALPDVLNHNLETIPRLQKKIRKFANWEHSLHILRHAKAQGFTTKTGIMVGLGETRAEVFEFLADMARENVDIVTVGQYLQPSQTNIAVQRYVEPAEFRDYAQEALRLGIPKCESGPLVRSSWHAAESAEKFQSAVATQSRTAGS